MKLQYKQDAFHRPDSGVSYRTASMYRSFTGVATLIMCDVSKFNNTNNFIYILFTGNFYVYRPLMSIRTIVVAFYDYLTHCECECVWESVSLSKYIKWPHDSESKIVYNFGIGFCA